MWQCHQSNSDFSFLLIISNFGCYGSDNTLVKGCMLREVQQSIFHSFPSSCEAQRSNLLRWRKETAIFLIVLMFQHCSWCTADKQSHATALLIIQYRRKAFAQLKWWNFTEGRVSEKSHCAAIFQRSSAALLLQMVLPHMLKADDVNFDPIDFKKKFP